MSNRVPSQTLPDETSFVIPLSNYNTYGLCQNYTLRRHKWEAEANAGCYEARRDWIKYIGPSKEFGGCNPVNGNFTATVMPLTRPERLGLIAYVIECTNYSQPYIYNTELAWPILHQLAYYISDAFLYDTVLELEQPNLHIDHNHVDDSERQKWKHIDPALGRAQIQAKIMTQLASVDGICAERVKSSWKEAFAIGSANKNKQFASLEEYVDFRVVDSAAYFVEALVLFGMGLTLTKEEDALLEPIRKPCFAALAIANDYVSFDREYAEFEDSGKLHSLKNAVWLQMRLHDVDVDVAKKMVLDITRQYEDQFLENCMRFRREDSNASEKLNLYLDALAYQVPGNLVWSLNAPRYHSDARYDPNAGLEDEISAKLLPTALGINYNVRIVNTVKEDSHQPGTVGPDANGGHSRKASTDTCLTISDETGSTTDDNASVSSRSSVSSSSEIEKTIAVHTPMSECLDSRHVKAPVDYIKSLPSGGARDIFVNALAIWFDAPPEIVSRIKSLGNRLHSASLILDDIEDGSGLRRGQPAAHTVFGTAQTINSGCYEILKAVEEAQQLGSEAVKIVLEELDDLHIGQSYDLYWTQHSLCPSEDEYLEMVTKKTGGLFRLMARLLLEFSVNKVSNKHLITDIEHLVSLIGMQYQIRDDYQNLYCEDYCEKKGFCQDLDEGKFSFPLIHALNVHSDSTKLLRELLQRRRDVGCLSFEQKKLVLRQLDCAGSMTYTRETLKRLEGEVYEGVKRVEGATKMENWILRALLQKLEV